MNIRKIQSKAYLSILLLLLPLLASAHDFEVDGVYYNITDSTELTVEVTYEGQLLTDYTNAVNNSSYRGDVVIPTTVTQEGITYRVTSIGGSAFYQAHELISVTISEGITSIGLGAFTECNLSTITLPESLVTIGEYAFNTCRDLTSITIPKGVKSIKEAAFAQCQNLISVTIPDNSKLTLIGGHAFYDCRSLTSITIPKSVTSIERRAFAKCAKLSSVYCYSEKVPATAPEVFLDSTTEIDTLYVPASAWASYKTTEPWSGFGNIVAQGSDPIAIDGKKWHTRTQVPYIDDRYTNDVFMWVEGDTIVEDIRYKKLYKQTRNVYDSSMETIEVGYCRQVGDKYYQNGKLMFDFGLQVGDKFTPQKGDPLTVKRIGSMTLNDGLSRKYLMVVINEEDTDTIYNADYWIEGLGSLRMGILTNDFQSVGLVKELQSCSYNEKYIYKKEDESKPYLVTEGKEWAVERYTMGGVQGVYSYCLQGDTIINGKEYKIEHEGCGKDLSGMKPSGRYMREENGRVYSYVHTERYKDEDEVLFFDFNLEDGDTIVYIPDVYSLHVMDVYDAVVPHSDGQSRKCYEVELWNIREEGVYDSDDFGGTFVEGIGNLCSGLSDPGFGLVGSNQRLLYVKQGDTILYQREEENPKEQSKFFADDTKWYGEEVYVYYSSHHRTSISYSLGTDTVIDGQLGQTLYRDGEYQGTFFVKGESVWFKPSTIFSWFINIEEEEELPTFLLYDFSLQVGDTIFYDERSLGYTYEKTEEYSPNSVVKAVREVHGRKVIDFDDGEQWIEGIGSIREPFLERWRPRLTGPGNIYESIYQVVADSATIWFKGELANPNIEPWLKAGMTWTENKQYNEGEDYVSHQIKLGKGSLPGRFSVSITGMDSWEKPFYELQVFNNKVYGLGMNSIILCYDFSLSVGNKVSLLKSYNYGLDNCYYYYDNCHVTKVDTVVYYGVPRKRIILSGDRDDVWVEGIGSLTRLFPLDNLDTGGDYSIMANYSNVVECSYKGNLLYRKDDLEITRPTIKRGYGLYHSDSYLYRYTIDESKEVTDSTDFARWYDRTVIRFDVDTIGYNAFSGATFRQGQIICFSDRLNTICKDAFAGINIVKRTSQEAPQISDDLTLVFEGTNPPGIDKNNILDYSDSTCHINFVVPDMATYIAEDNQWTYTTLMTIDDFIKGYVSSENEVTVTDPTEVTITDVEEGELSGGVENSSLVVVVEARPRKDIPVRIGDGENKDIYSRAPAWQRYTVELKVTDSSEALLYEGAMACSASDVCVFDVTLPCRPDDDVIYLHSRSIDMFDRATEWATRAVTLTRIEDVKTLDSDTYYDLQGRKVAHPTRGVYIKNGRKVIVK